MRSAPRMDLDFAPRSPWRRMTLALFALGVAGSIFALWQRHGLLAQREIAVASIDAQQRSVPRAGLSRPAAVRLEAVDEADRVVADLQRPWEPMLDALQAAVRPDVIVLRVQPDTDAFRLRIAGQADSGQAFVEFMQRLQGDASWRAVEPVSEAGQPAGAVADGKPLSFQLAAEWRRP